MQRSCCAPVLWTSTCVLANVTWKHSLNFFVSTHPSVGLIPTSLNAQCRWPRVYHRGVEKALSFVIWPGEASAPGSRSFYAASAISGFLRSHFLGMYQRSASAIRTSLPLQVKKHRDTNTIMSFVVSVMTCTALYPRTMRTQQTVWSN
ncbi:hypothetical protein BC826DRAFT_187470 [Russula brevipes]|nr:hypothetical protein BC826DRAFT_187470 [Russula brevipes]